VRELAEAWRAAAWRNTVFPLGDDGSLMRQRPASELRFEAAVTIFPGTPTLERFRSNKLTKLRSFEIIARLDAAVDDGVIVAHGDQGGGYLLFIENGRLCLSYNEYGRMHRVSAPLDGSVGAGDGAIRAAFTALPDFAASVSVSVDGTEVLTLGPVAQLISMAPFTGISVGVDRGSPVDWELFERHRSFPMRSGLRCVEYVPGPKAPYNGELIAQIERDMERTYE